MHKLHLPVVFFLLILTLPLHAQVEVIEFELVKKTHQVPLTLTSQRTAVVIATDQKNEEWKRVANSIHHQLRFMGIDAILYVHYQDYQASPTVNQSFRNLLAARDIRHLVFAQVNELGAKLAVMALHDQGTIKIDDSSWYAEGATLDEALLQLALDLKKVPIIKSNFLIAEYPETIEDLPLIKGSHFPNYPDHLKRLKLAVTLFSAIAYDSLSSALSPAVRSAIETYNAQIAQQNQQLRRAFDDYPYPHVFVEDATDALLYKKGYQYVLRSLHTSGVTIKQWLDYTTTNNETDYITMVPTPDGRRALKTIPINETVYKFYVEQTVASDVHVGRYYDAEQEFTKALSNFLGHLKNQFE